MLFVKIRPEGLVKGRRPLDDDTVAEVEGTEEVLSERTGTTVFVIGKEPVPTTGRVTFHEEGLVKLVAPVGLANPDGAPVPEEWKWAAVESTSPSGVLVKTGPAVRVKGSLPDSEADLVRFSAPVGLAKPEEGPVPAT